MKSQPSIYDILISNLNKNIRNQILHSTDGKHSLSKFLDKEKKQSVANLTDLRSLRSKNESEVYDTLNTMVKNNQYFMYCGPLLININPGPNKIKDYLNLQTWVHDTEALSETEWKPHLYSFMYFVYQTLVSEQKDQVVNMLGQIGSGKTFNIIHIIEYYCCMVGPEHFQVDTFDIIHKSIQLVHIMGSIFRENNLESTSCGILLRLGFGEDNKISYFDMDARILDWTLPFSENGRSFSVLHSFISAASGELKRNFYMPDEEFQLTFFRKFSKNFEQHTRNRFKLNDYEIWNRFHALLKFFDFGKGEVVEILQIFAFILSLNDLGMTKTTINGVNGYVINKGTCSRKIAKNFNIDEDEFIHKMGFFKELSEIKNTLISLMKYSYYIVFDYILKKIKSKLRAFFNNVYQHQHQSKPLNNNNNNNISSSSTKLLFNIKNIKYINFLDFPGEVDDQTLGGLLTNLANECINLYAGHSYSSVVEKLIHEKLFMKLFKPLHSYQVVRSIMGEKGFFSFLSNPFTEENYNNLRKEALKQHYYKKCVEFRDVNEQKGHHNDFKFNLHFSHKVVTYNYESLYLETKSMVNTSKPYKVFSISRNSIIKSTYRDIVPTKSDFFSYVSKTLLALFLPIENLEPFVIYCLHSNNSVKLFFGNSHLYRNDNCYKDWVIPKRLTMNMLKKSLVIPVLYWEWFGYHEWMDIDCFVAEYGNEFEKMEEKMRNKREGDMNVLFKNLNNYEKANHIVSSLNIGKDAIVGRDHILMKKGTNDKIRNSICKLKQINTEKDKGNVSLIPHSKTNAYYRTETKGSNNNIIKQKTSNKNIQKAPSIRHVLTGVISNDSASQLNIEKKQTLKTQCHLDIISPISFQEDQLDNAINNNKASQCSKYNLYRIFDHNTNDILESMCSQSDISGIDDSANKKQSVSPSKDLTQYRKKNNIIIPSKDKFNMVQNLFNFNKHTNFNIFDYSKQTPDIIKIQCAYRTYKAKQRHLLLRYIILQIHRIQAFTKGLCVRNKFARLKKCLQCITFIQNLYRIHYEHKCEKVIRIQREIRRVLAGNKMRRKMERMNECQENGDEYVDTSDEEKQNVIKQRNQKEREIYQKRQMEEIKKRKEMKKPYRHKEDVIKKKTMTKKKGMDLTRVKDKDKIISAILMDKDLMKENEQTNRRLANARGVNKTLKYELLQLDKNDNGNANKTSNAKNKTKRIEDKLIEYGEALKQKRAQEKVDKLKSEEMSYSFKPSIRKSNPKYMNKLNNKDFYSRLAYFEEQKESKIEQIKTTLAEPEQVEYSFRPELTKMAKSKKRTIDDLYKWQKMKEETIQNKINEKKEKERIELEEMERMKKKGNIKKTGSNRTPLSTKMNKSGSVGNVKGSAKKGREYGFEEEDEEIQLELWPEQFDKKYVKRGEDGEERIWGEEEEGGDCKRKVAFGEGNIGNCYGKEEEYVEEEEEDEFY